MKIQTTQRMYSINDIHRLLKSSELVIQPKYQRRRTTWPNNARTALVDTVINNFPIPPIYLRDYVNDKGKRIKEIIDGQQRIKTIIEFLNDKFKLSKVISDEEYIGLEFSLLPEETKIAIEDYELAFISIKGASESDIISIFSRLNSFSLPLNTQEKRNAKYTGILKSIIYELASKYNTFWRNFRILTSSQVARMADALLVSEIFYALLNDIKSSSAKDIDNMYKEFEEEFEDSTILTKRFNITMNFCGQLLEVEQIQKSFKTKYMFYSLFLASYEKLFGSKSLKSSIPLSLNIEKCKKNLIEFSEKLVEEKFSTEDLYMLKQATGNTKQRQFRHKTILKLIE